MNQYTNLTIFRLWNFGEYTQPQAELRTDVFERLFRACEIAKFDRDTKLIYEKDMITEGEAKGKAEERVMIAKAMIEEGIDTNTIAKVTGLSREEIASL